MMNNQEYLYGTEIDPNSVLLPDYDMVLDALSCREVFQDWSELKKSVDGHEYITLALCPEDEVEIRTEIEFGWCTVTLRFRNPDDVSLCNDALNDICYVDADSIEVGRNEICFRVKRFDCFGWWLV